MSERTKIQWCDETVNPVMGCSGCELFVPGKGGPCYTGCDHARKGQTNKGYAPEFFLPTLFSGRATKAAKRKDLTGTGRPEIKRLNKRGRERVVKAKPWLDGMPRLIFVSDMGDALSAGLFGKESDAGRYVRSEDVLVTRWGKDKNGRDTPKERTPRAGSIQEGGVPFNFLKAEIIDVARSENGQRHQWLWLTKLPARMAEFSRWLMEAHETRWPENVWAGASVTSGTTLWRAHELLNVGDQSTVRFLSVEPQWGELSLLEVFSKKPGGRWWIIGGGESWQNRDRTPPKFDLAWARKLRDECRGLQIPFFLKQLGGNPQENGASWKLTADKDHGGDWTEWPEDLRVREMPKGPWSVPPSSGETASHDVAAVVVERDGNAAKLTEAMKPAKAARAQVALVGTVRKSASAVGSVASPEAGVVLRQQYRDLYHWFLDEADRVRGGSDAKLRRRATDVLLPKLNEGQRGEAETSNFFAWVNANRTKHGTAGSVKTPPAGYDGLVRTLSALLV